MTIALRKWLIRFRLWMALCRIAPHTGKESDPSVLRVVVGLAADYGNVGDLAITHAQIKFLERAFPDAVVEPVPISQTLGSIESLRQSLRPGDVITLIGGGNTGDMYDDIQYLRELYIKMFPENRIISFPQTVDFSSTLFGRWAKRRIARVYGAHKRLAFLARDTRSATVASALFPSVPTETAPDVVLTIDASEPRAVREGVLVALRADLERGLANSDRDAIVTALGSVGPVRRRDTHVGDVRVDRLDADALVEDYWADWRSAAVVVTDRLHGMIFAVITDTPCVALDSGTGKVSQFYRDWLSEHPKVELVSSADPRVVLGAVRRVREASGDSPDLASEFAERFSTVLDASR